MKKPHETAASLTAKTTKPRRTGATAKKPAASDPLAEIRALRQEVAELTKQLQASQPLSVAPQNNLQPWLQIAATVGITLTLGKIMQALRLPAAVAVAVPMITAELNRKLF